MLRNLVIVLVVVAAATALAVSYVLNRAGELRSLEPVALPRCARVDGVPGAEDITIQRSTGTAFISSFDRRAALAGKPRQGAIFAYDLASPAPRPRELTTAFEAELYPHGLSLWEDEESGAAYLFVVNHPPAGHTIEIFAWRDGELDHLETIRDTLLVSPNDVLGVGPRSFYATNDHGRTEGLARVMEELLQRELSTVVYFDGERTREAAGGIAYANGIGASHDGRELYVAGTTRGRIHVFARDLTTGALEQVDLLELGTGADNIEVDRHGMLWVGAHPKLFTFLGHSRDAAKRSPSQVLWVDPDRVLDPPVRTVLLDLGELLSGSSVGAPWGSRLLVGSVFEPHFLDCERDTGAL